MDLGGKTPPAPSLIIRPTSGWVPLNLWAIWEYRELLFFLTWRDIKVRYKQTALGITWVVIQPFLIMVVFSIFFGFLAKVPSDGIPYPIFVFSALVPWQLFANALIDSSNSLIANQHLITKVYFPRLLIPLSAVLTRLVDFAFALLVLFGMIFYYGTVPSRTIWALPLFILLTATIALGVGLWLSALNVKYRDMRHTIPFIIQFWFFSSPIAYPSSLVPEPWQLLYRLNPMVGVIEGFRWVLLGGDQGPRSMLLFSLAIVLFLLLSGLYYFRRVERTVADVV